MKSINYYLKEDYSNNPLQDLSLRTYNDPQEEVLKAFKVALESELDADRIYADLENMIGNINNAYARGVALKIIKDIRGEELKHAAQLIKFIQTFSELSDRGDYLDGAAEAEKAFGVD